MHSDKALYLGEVMSKILRICSAPAGLFLLRSPTKFYFADVP